MYEHPLILTPPFIVVNGSATEQEVAHALEEWQLTGPFVLVQSHQLAVILDPEQQEHLWIYLPDDPKQQTDQIMLRSDEKMTLHQHMRLLYKHGFAKAVVMETIQRQPLVTIVFFKNVTALPPQQEGKKRERTAWPEKQSQQCNHTQIFDSQHIEDRTPAANLSLDMPIEELQAFFNPDHHPLH